MDFNVLENKIEKFYWLCHAFSQFPQVMGGKDK